MTGFIHTFPPQRGIFLQTKDERWTAKKENIELTEAYSPYKQKTPVSIHLQEFQSVLEAGLEPAQAFLPKGF